MSIDLDEAEFAAKYGQASEEESALFLALIAELRDLRSQLDTYTPEGRESREPARERHDLVAQLGCGRRNQATRHVRRTGGGAMTSLTEYLQNAVTELRERVRAIGDHS